MQIPIAQWAILTRPNLHKRGERRIALPSLLDYLASAWALMGLLKIEDRAHYLCCCWGKCSKVRILLAGTCHKMTTHRRKTLVSCPFASLLVEGFLPREQTYGETRHGVASPPRVLPCQSFQCCILGKSASSVAVVMALQPPPPQPCNSPKAAR